MKTNWILSLAVLCLVALTSCNNDTTADDATASTTAQVSPTTTPTPSSTPASKPAATQTAAVPTGPTTTMDFEEMSFDFGEIDEGERVQHTYAFKNTGKEPLVISNAKGTCGCTVPQWPKDPIAPGEEGEILVEFNSKGKSGPQTKRVILTANTNPQTTNLEIKGKVNKKDQPAASNG